MFEDILSVLAGIIFMCVALYLGIWLGENVFTPKKSKTTEELKYFEPTKLDLANCPLKDAEQVQREFEEPFNTNIVEAWNSIQKEIDKRAQAGKGYVELFSETYKQIPYKVLIDTLKYKKYDVKNSTGNNFSYGDYCMGFILTIKWVPKNCGIEYVPLK